MATSKSSFSSKALTILYEKNNNSLQPMTLLLLLIINFLVDI